jgi:hypothetical protein
MPQRGRAAGWRPRNRHVGVLVKRSSAVPGLADAGRTARFRQSSLRWGAVPKPAITLSYEEALYIAELLAVAADAASNDESVPDTFPEEARLAINLILSRTDD